jgi:hypothetical protein
VRIKVRWQAHVDPTLLGDEGMHLGHKFIPNHVQQLLYEGQLQYLLIDDRENKLEVVLHSPLEHAILIVVVGLGCLLLEEDVLDKDIQQV